MGGNGKRVGVGGGGELFDSRQAQTQLCTVRGRRETGAQAGHRFRPESGETPSTKSIACEYQFSPWTCSSAKRAMDIGAVLVFSPVLVPVVAAIALAVLVTSGAPILFRQERTGRNGAPFVIYKFRTMRPALVQPSSAMAIASASRVTWLGALLRKSKLDELPQIFNVLAGEMSLVGPRPKVPEQEPAPLPCRPGVTGAATLVFAREEMIMQGIASDDLNEYFQKTILSAKRDLDADYLRRATIFSDLWIIVNTVLGRWESCGGVTSWLDGNENHLENSVQTASL